MVKQDRLLKCKYCDSNNFLLTLELDLQVDGYGEVIGGIDLDEETLDRAFILCMECKEYLEDLIPYEEEDDE